jgi:hypothetical protein
MREKMKKDTIIRIWSAKGKRFIEKPQRRQPRPQCANITTAEVLAIVLFS